MLGGPAVILLIFLLFIFGCVTIEDENNLARYSSAFYQMNRQTSIDVSIIQDDSEINEILQQKYEDTTPEYVVYHIRASEECSGIIVCSLKLPDGYEEAKTTIYSLEQDGTLIEIDFLRRLLVDTTDDGYIGFVTDVAEDNTYIVVRN